MKSQHEKCVEFSDLHQQEEAFLIPNPWDVGTARLLEGMGYKALATTSAGLAYTLGRIDGTVSLEEIMAHCRAMTQSTQIPVNADFENGFAHDPQGVAKNVLALIDTGVAGCSIEDFNQDTESIYDFNLSVERIQAAVEAVASSGLPFQLTARAENLLRGINDLEDTLKRLKAFESAGAQVLYAPGIASLKRLKDVTNELRTPLNVLAPPIPGASVARLSEAGAARISVGGALNLAAVSPVLSAGKEMLSQGTFNWVDDMASRKFVNSLMASQ